MASSETGQEWAARAEIISVVQGWGYWRDNELWDDLQSAYTPDAWMFTSWSALPAAEFVQACKNNMNQKKYAVRHDAGSSHVRIQGDKALVQTNNVLRLRGQLHGITVDMNSYGRTFDRFARTPSGWKISQRHGVYEKGRIDPVVPGESLELDKEMFETYPEAYRHLAYFQVNNGGKVSLELPVPGNAVMAKIQGEANAWLADAAA